MNRLLPRVTGFAAALAALLAAAQVSLSPARADYGALDGDIEIENLPPIPGLELTGGFATLSDGGSPYLRIYDAESAGPLREIALSTEFRYLDLEPAVGPDSAGTLLVLGVRKSNGGVRVWRWNPLSMRMTGSLAFGSNLSPMDLETIDTDSGESAVAVLGLVTSSERTRLLVKSFDRDDADRTIDLGRRFGGQDLELYQSVGSAPLASVLGVSHGSGASVVSLVPLDAPTASSSVSFGRIDARDHLVLRSPLSGEPSLTVLREKTGSRFVRVETRDTDGTRIGLTAIRTDAQPVKLLRLSDTSGEPTIGLLTDHPLHHQSVVHTIELGDGERHPTLNFGAGAETSDAVGLMDGIGGEPATIAVAQSPVSDGGGRIKIRTLENLRRRTVPVDIDTRVPAWLESNRVHGLTRLPLIHPRQGIERSFYDSDLSATAALRMRELGARVFVRHAKSADEDPWWPSAAPEEVSGESRYSAPRDNEGVFLERDRNPIQDYINEARANDMPVILYYADSGEQTLAAEHPDWICRSASGEGLTHVSKGFFLDLTSGYGDVVLTRLLELADMGADGIYLDFRHMPANGCWGTELERGFVESTGAVAPPVQNTPEYLRFVRYFADRVVEVLSGWEEALAAEYPDVQLMVSVTSVPALTRADMSSRLAAVASPKSEFHIPVARGQSNSVFSRNPDLHAPDDDVRIAFGWSLLRDVAEEDLPHIWTASAPDRDHLLAFVSAATAYGMIAAVDVVEELLSPDGAIDGLFTREDIAAAFDLGSRISPELSGTRPVRWAGVHFSESARDLFLRDSERAWEQVLLPAVAAFDALTRLGMPVKVVTDDMLLAAGLDDLSVLHVAAPRLTDAEQQAVLDRFTARGGVLLSGERGGGWATEIAYEQGIDELTSELAAHVDDSPVSADGLPDGVHLVAHRSPPGVTDPRVVLAVTNRFDFVQSFTIGDLPLQEPVNPSPPVVPAGVEIRLTAPLLDALAPMESGLSVRDAVTGQALDHTVLGEEIVLALPSFKHMALIVIEPS